MVQVDLKDVLANHLIFTSSKCRIRIKMFVISTAIDLEDSAKCLDLVLVSQLIYSVQTKDTLRDFEEDSIRADKFIALVKKYTDFSELTPQMINEFVDKIVVHEGKWENCERTQEVEVYLNFIGKFEMPKKEPTKEELEELEKLRKKREKKREYNYRYMQKLKDRIETEGTT